MREWRRPGRRVFQLVLACMILGGIAIAVPRLFCHLLRRGAPPRLPIPPQSEVTSVAFLYRGEPGKNGVVLSEGQVTEVLGILARGEVWTCQTGFAAAWRPPNADTICRIQISDKAGGETFVDVTPIRDLIRVRDSTGSSKGHAGVWYWIGTNGGQRLHQMTAEVAKSIPK